MWLWAATITGRRVLTGLRVVLFQYSGLAVCGLSGSGRGVGFGV